ncbi:copper amine oxidase N-terminal domain-containing protein [Natranaerobius thermophilus]|uniref:Copper amine oxidase domain protein n=1 Tax=Natranaerobius thermophilus (strain ATCC BAA-1301 / DSM 18059 / JW/NM-WN-LF) TaxID=457570 RepID=B2A613_NATTJ|nr:copper amine oxidase N-terminal domain-containing protein [Natranaerobius thermophilus]ACB85430.1 copper amine oxidase domain protein [Natranaerobius thermophilus JW/NM-WN-LF]
MDNIKIILNNKREKTVFTQFGFFSLLFVIFFSLGLVLTIQHPSSVSADDDSDQQYERIDDLKVTVNEKEIKLQNDIKVQDGRILMPARSVFEAIGATMEWDGDKQVAYAQRNKDRVALPIGEDVAIINGDRTNLDVSSRLIKGRTYIPFRFTGEAFGGYVEYDGEEGIVDVILPDEEQQTNKQESAGESNHNKEFDESEFKENEQENNFPLDFPESPEHPDPPETPNQD